MKGVAFALFCSHLSQFQESVDIKKKRSIISLSSYLLFLDYFNDKKRAKHAYENGANTWNCNEEAHIR